MPVISKICPMEPSIARWSATRSLVVPSPFTPNDVSRRTPWVLVGELAPAGELAAAGELAVAGALAPLDELAPLGFDAPPPRRYRSATASGLAASPPPPHAASTNAPPPANNDVRNLRRTVSSVLETGRLAAGVFLIIQVFPTMPARSKAKAQANDRNHTGVNREIKRDNGRKARTLKYELPRVIGMRIRAGASEYPKRSPLKAKRTSGLVKQVFRKGSPDLHFDGAKAADEMHSNS
ncbi:hypothetical protein [Paraburkholderia sp. BL6665CI2N2]|uniref:hypothetical protein n=1 Tax=Paraburkholderia sp. BL6665CI2N2 TaxID=1938806 RepID=UPI001FBAD953|nr:hypothetical protein [Paraburkholderia sp. BL6665CI2N2]